MKAEKKIDHSEIIQLVSFKLGKEEFGVDILVVQEINRMLKITKVPNSPSYVEGVSNLRGRIVPIVDLRTKMGMPRVKADKSTRIIVVEVEGITLGFIVDEVSEVLRISSDIIEPPPELVSGVNSDFITSVGKMDDRLLLLLDLNKIIEVGEIDSLAI